MGSNESPTSVGTRLYSIQTSTSGTRTETDSALAVPTPVALVSMPWMSANMPSIQLATVAAALGAAGIKSRVYELYLDYAATITLALYDVLSNGNGFTEEWLFAQHFFGPETENWLHEFLPVRPRLGLKSAEIEEQILRALAPATGKYLDRMCDENDWSQHEVVGFSLTISQMGSSMAMARRIKLKYPNLKVVFGGTACAGPAGEQILKICPYVDIVYKAEAETSFPQLIFALSAGGDLRSVPGICFREGARIISTETSTLHHFQQPRPILNWDSYFQRLKVLDLSDQVGVWLPFESSRGCWWGEKEQCTFCGLHEIMKYRERRSSDVLDELETWATKYGVRNFFAVDLILPHTFYTTLLPELVAKQPGWVIFYEIKANVSRERAQMLARAGVTWVQPGIESLNGRALELMKKGVRPLQNVQLLKWCRELGIRVTWNIILGIPGEDPSSYGPMAAMMRKLFHLQPPNGRSTFALHRFSPYFEKPEDYGITISGPDPLYRRIFPVDESILGDLVYQFDYEVEGRAETPEEYAKPAVEAILEWRTLYKARHPELTFRINETGAEIVDTRGPMNTIQLDSTESAVYALLDVVTSERQIALHLDAVNPSVLDELNRRGGLTPLLDKWDQFGLILRDSNQLIGLAVNWVGERENFDYTHAPIPAPLPYLENPVIVNA